ncbi:hypothetical protein [Gloeobacter violaceus]|uniref:Glr1888 protein n=1 Tax=Gloeobacter violaceus (strain ATCC 29082 / PCC 7421) TaxID=251221 RepID=Q7NJE4_GLOVI|nr:hypothetical protein [Gloeobacter violaceus]BAC89829.1 glr1888 [Gloeobacter violaceus PCC 7421]
MLTVSSSKLWAAAAALPMLLLGTAIAQAAPWTAAASTGVVDEEDLQLISANEGRVEVIGSAPVPATLNLRYNIVALDELVNLTSTSPIDLRARYRDNGSNARVELRLKAYNYETGVTTTLFNFDSNAFPANSSYQTQTECFFLGAPLDFTQNVYFIDALLTKSSSGGTASLATIALGFGSCSPQ